jgi:hypothetical protein
VESCRGGREGRDVQHEWVKQERVKDVGGKARGKKATRKTKT